MYNFARIGVLHPVDKSCILISRNIMEGLKYDEHHPLPGSEHNHRFVGALFFILMQSTTASYHVDSTGTNTRWQLLLSDAVSQSAVLRSPISLDKMVVAQRFLELASRCGGVQFWGAVSAFEVSFGGGTFKRCEGGRYLASSI
jgi:hypothetical protein